MSLILDPEKGSKNSIQPGVKYLGTYTSVSEMDPKNLHHLSQEANELLRRLNELASANPFNIMYKAKINDPR